MEPDFIVIGAMKSGTTSLHAYLREHPQIFMPARKELRFFEQEGNWKRGWAWYTTFFAAGGDVAALGEATPTYTMYPLRLGVPERMAKCLPDVRLIYLIRHPIERMCSHYLRQSAARIERRGIDEALLENQTYQNTSRYAMQIERYLDYFPLEQLLVITTEDLRNQRRSTLERVYRFLGVDPSWPSPAHQEQHNPSAFAWIQRLPGYGTLSRATPDPLKKPLRRLKVAASPLDPKRKRPSRETWQQLEHLLRPDLERLRRYVGDDFHCWGMA
jgi:hypothetical protein